MLYFVLFYSAEMVELCNQEFEIFAVVILRLKRMVEALDKNFLQQIQIQIII